MTDDEKRAMAKRLVAGALRVCDEIAAEYGVDVIPMVPGMTVELAMMLGHHAPDATADLLEATARALRDGTFDAAAQARVHAPQARISAALRRAEVTRLRNRSQGGTQ